MRIRKAVLPVAGLGTRVLPATKAIPKELLPVVDRPVIQYVVDEALEAGIEHIVFVTGRGKSAIEDYFDHAYELEDQLRIKGKTAILASVESSRLPAGASSFVRQQAPLGLGHAVWCARDVIGHEPFAVLLPDVIVKGQPSSLKQMVDAFDSVGGNIIAVDPVPMERVSAYGVIAPESREGRLIRMSGMVEKPPRRIGAVKPQDHRAVYPPARNFRSVAKPGARCRRRDPADRRHGPSDAGPAFLCL